MEEKKEMFAQEGQECVSSERERKWTLTIGVALRFFLLFGTWILLSGMLDAFHLFLGVLSSAFVTWLSFDFFPKELDLCRKPMSWISMTRYVVWLMIEIIKANFAMLRLVFRKDIEAHMDPQIIHLKTRLRNPLALTLFANSVTLTPGTISVTINGEGEFSVHTIDAKSAENLPGEMENIIGRIFGE